MTRGWATSGLLLSTLTLSLVLCAGYGAWIADPQFRLLDDYRWLWAVLLGVLLASFAYVVGLPDAVRSRGHAVRRATLAAFACFMVMAALQWVAAESAVPRPVLALVAVLFVLSAPLWFAVHSASVNQNARGRLLLVMNPDEVGELATDLARDHGDRLTTMTIERPVDFVARTTAVSTGVDHDVALIVLGRTAQVSEDVLVAAAVHHRDGVRVRTLGQFYEEWLGKIPLSDLERQALLSDIGDIHLASYSRLKRVMDLLCALALSPLFVLTIPVVAVGNLFGNRGPLFYSQDRVGHHGRVFQIHKFRTMRPCGSDETGWTQQDDPRVTPFGALLRRSHIDELPQIVNILSGQLSMVGPRPEQPHYVAELAEQIPFYQSRHLVRPGLTGWAQVRFRYGSSVADAVEKLQFDVYYVRNQSLRLDARCLLRTTRTVTGTSTELAGAPAAVDLGRTRAADVIRLPDAKPVVPLRPDLQDRSRAVGLP